MNESEIKEHITVVIPAKNEAEMIAEIIESVRPFAHEVLVVDGHSDDGTFEIATRCGARVIRDRGRGKGDAIRCAIAEIQTPFVVFIDADGSHDPQDIPKLALPLIEGIYDHVTGSRLIGGSSELHGGFDECFRLMGSSFITACINWRFKVRLSDSQNGFRAIKLEVLKQLDLKEDVTTIEQEMIIKSLRKGFKMGEVPTHEYPRKYGTSKINIYKAAFRYCYSVVKYMFF